MARLKKQKLVFLYDLAYDLFALFGVGVEDLVHHFRMKKPRRCENPEKLIL